MIARAVFVTSRAAIHQNDEPDMEDERIKSPFGSSFRTFDGTDYSNIATIDVKKNIFDMCTDMSDLYIAVVEVSRRQKVHQCVIRR